MPSTDRLARWRGRKLLVLRGVWGLIATLYISSVLAGLPLIVQQYRSLTGAALITGFSRWSTDGLRAGLAAVGVSIEAYTALRLFSEFSITLTFIALGLLVFWRRSDEWFGWFTSLFLVSFGCVFNNGFAAMKEQYPAWVYVFNLGLGLPWFMFYVFFYTFPDGRFTPRWTAPWSVVLMIAIAITSFLSTNLVYFAIVLFAFGSAGFAQIYRYGRASNPLQRAQTKWVMYSILLVAFLELFGQGVVRLAFPHLRVEGPARIVYELWLISLVPVFAMLPISLTIAILRYRLWDIDVLIRRTLQYSLLSGLLALVYFGLIVVLQGMFTAISGERSGIAVVISTLAIAALVLPLRRRVQEFIDKRFYRQKYDAQKVLTEFAATVRDETDLEALTARLMEVVEETMQPESIILWLKPTHSSRPPMKD